jgi:hypothetical protein
LTLDQRIASALSTDQLSSTDLAALIVEVDDAIMRSDASARVSRRRSIDPLVHDPISERGAAEDAEFVSQRLRVASTPLRERYEKALAKEALVTWEAEAGTIRQKTVDLLAYPVVTHSHYG